MSCTTYLPSFSVKLFFQQIYAILQIRPIYLIISLKIIYSDTIDTNETKLDWNDLWLVYFQNCVRQPLFSIQNGHHLKK